MRAILLICGSVLAGCASIDQAETFELTVESCYEMMEDREHRYWKHELTIQSCELLLMEYEESKAR